MTTMDLYKILDISSTATHQEIKEKYRKLALQLHPDKNPNISAEKQEELKTKFQDPTLAYNTLKDPVKRQEYDKLNYFNCRCGSVEGLENEFDFDFYFTKITTNDIGIN